MTARPGIARAPVNGQTATIQQMVWWGRVPPSAESERAELRWQMGPLRPDPTHRGHCLTCDPKGKRWSRLDGLDRCERCWRETSQLVVRLANPDKARPVFRDPTSDDWDSTFNNGPELILFRTAEVVTVAKPDAWIFYLPDEWLALKPAIRPWQRRPWQETPLGRPWTRPSLRYDRCGVSRIDVLNAGPVNSDAPYRRDGIHHRGLVLRCLVCLGPPEAFRPRHDEDQSCKACDQAWRRAGRPWFDAFDTFVEKRRRKYLRDNPGAHLAALDRAQFAQVDQVPPRRSPRSTRPYYKTVVRTWDNGSRDIRAGNVSFSHAWSDDITVPDGWKRLTWDVSRIVPKLPPTTLEDWRTARGRSAGTGQSLFTRASSNHHRHRHPSF
jgi:hypothetical protein